jgi:hypothetical protein
MVDDPCLPRHHLTVRLHSVQLETLAPLPEERHQQQQQLVCVAEIERFGRLRTEACASSSEEATCWQFEEVRIFETWEAQWQALPHCHCYPVAKPPPAAAVSVLARSFCVTQPAYQALRPLPCRTLSLW